MVKCVSAGDHMGTVTMPTLACSLLVLVSTVVSPPSFAVFLSVGHSMHAHVFSETHKAS